jgi:kinesin family protein 6/9
MDALDLLFLGDTNRVVAATSLNDNSTRSHCIFQLFIERTLVGSDKVRKSLLNLVDLAGSERLGKSDVDLKSLFSESKNINLSLHYLEQVIVALQEKSAGARSHVPYRNSLLTWILRDSLGGNCRTSMIATISLDERYISESISTCRFSQRVASVRTDAIVNEVSDPLIMIKQLKQRIASLTDEIAVLRGPGDAEPELTSEQQESLKERILEYMNSDSADGNSPILFCGSIMRVSPF